jgi:NHL repeat
MKINRIHSFAQLKAAALAFGLALILSACGGSATTTGAVGDDSDGSVLIVSTFAGKAGEPGYANGQGSAARFSGPLGIAVDNSGNVYVTESGNHVVRKITASGNVSLLAGTPGVYGDENGPPGTAKLSLGTGLAVDVSSNVYVPDGLGKVKKINASGVVSDFAGRSDGQRGDDDGPLSQAQFDRPFGVAVAKDGTVYIGQGRSDQGEYALRSISPQGTVTTIGGLSSTSIRGVTLDNAGNRYIARSESIDKIPVGGSSFNSYSSGLLDFFGMANFAIDQNTNTFVLQGNSIYRIKPDGSSSIFAGSLSEKGSQDGLLLNARFYTDFYGAAIGGVAIAPDGTMYVTDAFNSTIRKISKGFYVGGKVTGLATGGKVVLQNNGGVSESITQNGSFTFSMPVAQSATYTAALLSAEGHSCVLVNATGQVTSTVSKIEVNCTPTSQPPLYSGGGVVSGLPVGKSVILKNGSDTLSITSNGAYTFLVRALTGTAYNVRVDTQPIGRTCSVSNGVGAIGSANVTNANVSCSTSTHTISGSALGLVGTVQLQNNSLPVQSLTSNGNFTLTGTVNYGDAFDVRITAQPVAQTCELKNLLGLTSSPTQVTGTMAGNLSLNLNCRTNTYTVTAAVTGSLAGDTVSLQMTGAAGGTQTLQLTGAAPGNFTYRVAHGTSVGLSVLSSPAGKTCSVTTPMVITDVNSSVVVSCVNNAPVLYTVGGTISGLPAMTNINLAMLSNDLAANQFATGLTNGAYQFLTSVTSASEFSISATSPVGYLCTVQNGYGSNTIISANVTNANVNCVAVSGGGGGGFTPGSVNGSVTNNGPDQRQILMVNGVNQVAVLVDSNSTANFTLPGQLSEGVGYNVTASDVTTPTPGSGLLNCGVSNGTGNMLALPGAISNVSVSCMVAIP